MGKHPEDLVSSITSPTYTMCDLLLKDVLDQQLSPLTNQAVREVLSIAKIAFACLHTISQSRPNNAASFSRTKSRTNGHLQNPNNKSETTLTMLISQKTKQKLQKQQAF